MQKSLLMIPMAILALLPGCARMHEVKQRAEWADKKIQGFIMKNANGEAWDGYPEEKKQMQMAAADVPYYCYSTLGQVDCYQSPIKGEEGRLLGKSASHGGGMHDDSVEAGESWTDASTTAAVDLPPLPSTAVSEEPVAGVSSVTYDKDAPPIQMGRGRPSFLVKAKAPPAPVASPETPSAATTATAAPVEPLAGNVGVAAPANLGNVPAAATAAAVSAAPSSKLLRSVSKPMRYNSEGEAVSDE